MSSVKPGGEQDQTKPVIPNQNSNLNPELQEAQGWLEEGQQILEDSAVLSPQEAIAHCNEALAAFKRARELAGDDPELGRAIRLAIAAAYSQRGHQLRYAHDHAQALADLSQAIKLNPTFAEDYYYRALSYLAKGDQRLARADFTEYLKRGENEYLREVARERLSNLVPDKVDTDATLKHWRAEGVRLTTAAANIAHPRDESATPEWAEAVRLYNKAIEAYDHALEVSSKDMMTRLSLLAALVEQAEGYRHMEEYDLALENYQRAQQLKPQPRHVFLQGETLLEAGRTAQARAAFEEYLKQPDDQTMRSQAVKYLQATEKKAGR